MDEEKVIVTPENDAQETDNENAFVMPEDDVQKTGSEKIIVAMSEKDMLDMVKLAAEAGAKAAMDRIAEERKNMRKKSSDRRLHNTKLLLKNYRMLKDNAENSVFGRSQMEESAADILTSMMNLYDDEVIVESIKRSASRTAIIVAHIETMMGLYEAYCSKSGNQIDMRRYEVIYDMHIAEDPMTVKEIAKKHHMSKENVYSDLKISYESLTALIFGVDGLTIS